MRIDEWRQHPGFVRVLIPNISRDSTHGRIDYQHLLPEVQSEPQHGEENDCCHFQTPGALNLYSIIINIIYNITSYSVSLRVILLGVHKNYRCDNYQFCFELLA